MKIGDTIITIPATKVNGTITTKALLVQAVSPTKPLVIDTVDISNGAHDRVNESQVVSREDKT